MKRILFAFAALALLLPATAQPSKAGGVSVDFFYNNLSGGDWIEVADYGYVWQPSVAVSNTSWRPYADGYWAYTDLGWTWVSYEDFGWATYHYGRWSRLHHYGWVWVPGRDQDLEWGPAWVSWRTGGDYVGWAPLPPSRGRYYEGHGITGRVDIDFDIGPSYYNFVDVRYIGEPVLRERIVAVNQNVTYINQTTNVTNITYKNQTVYNYGPDINVLNSRATRPIQRLQIERQENVDLTAAAKSGALMKPQGDKLVVAAPMHINKGEGQLAPEKIKTKVAKADIDNGWSGVSDPNVKTQMRQKMQTEDAKSAQIGAGVSGQAASGASPAVGANVSGSAATGASLAPLEKGKGKNKSEQSAAGAGVTSPAGVASPAAGASATGAVSGAESTTMQRHGKNTNEKAHGEKFQQGAQATAGAEATTAPATGGAAIGATEQNSQLGGGGKHNRKALEQTNSSQAPSHPNEPSSVQGQGQGPKARRLEHEQQQLGSGPQTAVPSGAPGGTSDVPPQGGGNKHKAERALSQPAAPSGASGGASDVPPQGGGNIHKAERAVSQPAAPEGQAQPQGQGKQEGGKNNKDKGEASPVPSPQ